MLFPNYFEELRTLQTAMLRDAGKSEAEITAAVEMAAKTQTPVMSAVMGAVGTIVTGILASLIIAIFHRKKYRSS